MSDGRLLQVNVSDGGVPKRPVPEGRVGWLGVDGDRQAGATVHGGPHRAVSLLGIEAIRRVAAEGHPIGPGTTGENLTTDGFDVGSLPVGTRLAIGAEVVLELASPVTPCRTIRRSFTDLRFGRLSPAAHPADARMYARVVREGTVRPGDPIRLTPPLDDAAQHFVMAKRLDAAELVSSVAFWEAARTAGHDIDILADGEIAVAAAPALPGAAFNQGLGFAGLPQLVSTALDHFATAGVTGWVMADAPPWEGAITDSVLARYAAQPGAVAPTNRLTVRRLERHETGVWAEVIAAASQLSPPIAAAWRALEPQLARSVHHHRYVAEVEGRPVAAASLHVHHRLGWMRAGSVVPEFRGQGIQRALIAHRARDAARLGCDLLGASAIEGGASARNLERLGFERIGTRRTYRADRPV